MQNRIVIIGGGGHGKVVHDAIVSQGIYSITGFVDATLPVGTIIINDHKVIVSQEAIQTLKDKADFFVVAIGNNKIRKELYNMAKQLFIPAVIIHPSAVVSSNVKIGAGSVVLANSVVNAFSTVAENSIVNSGVVIDHESKIGSHVHLSIGTLVGSNSEVADNYKSAIGEKIESFSKIS